MQLHSFTSHLESSIARGTELGSAFGPQIREVVSLYLRFFRDMGISSSDITAITQSSLAALRNWRPEQADELAAMARACGLEDWQVAAVNSRTEVLAAAGAAAHECSTIAHAPQSGVGWGMQTWDWHPSLVPQALVWNLRTNSGRRVKTFTEFGAQGKIGVNDAGIGVFFNILSHQSDRGVGGVPVHSVARAVLDEAQTIDEAREIIDSAAVTASTALTVMEVAPESSRAVSFEMSAAGIGEVLPDATGVLVRANHFIDPALATGETVEIAESKTLERYAHLQLAAQTTVSLGTDTRSRADALFDEGAGKVLCFTPDPAAPETQQWQTIVTIGFDLPAFGLDIAQHAPGPIESSSFQRF